MLFKGRGMVKRQGFRGSGSDVQAEIAPPGWLVRLHGGGRPARKKSASGAARGWARPRTVPCPTRAACWSEGRRGWGRDDPQHLLGDGGQLVLPLLLRLRPPTVKFPDGVLVGRNLSVVRQAASRAKNRERRRRPLVADDLPALGCRPLLQGASYHLRPQRLIM